MKNTTRLFIISTSIFVGVLLVGSSLSFPTLAQSAGSQLNWVGPDGSFPFNFDYASQSVIGTSNVNNLQVSWLFPIPTAPPSFPGAEGAIVTPIVYKGIIYFDTNYNTMYALSATDGHTIWSKAVGSETFQGAASTSGHQHAIWLTTTVRNKPLVWMFANNNSIFAWNALTGDQELSFALLPKTVPGNFGIYGTFGHSMTIDEKDGMLVAGGEGSEGTDAARCVLFGYDITQTPPVLKWMTFCAPPGNGSDPSWSFSSVQNLTHAYIFNGTGAVDLKALSTAQQHSLLDTDWGTFGFNGTRSFAGTGLGWGGSWAVDPTTNMAYVGTSQPGPDFNQTTRPGPNLWSASVLAINDKTGQMVWGFQSIAHDMWDYDCAWNVILANATVNGNLQKTVFKSCKDGFTYALNAGTGALLWSYRSPSIKWSRDVYIPNPLNSAQMHQTYAGQPYSETVMKFDNTGTGQIEADMAYDPASNLLFAGEYNYPTTATVGPVTGPHADSPYGAIGIKGSFGGIVGNGQPINTTVTAINVNTGKAVWETTIQNVPFRGGVTVSNGVVYVARMDGTLQFINEKDGSTIGTKLLGGPMVIQPSIGTDTNGQTKLYIPISSSSVFPIGVAPFPGVVVALGLASPSGGSQTTVTQTGPGQTVTSVVGGTTTTGIDPTTFYAVTAVAVIFIIATGFLAIRRRKPAS